MIFTSSLSDDNIADLINEITTEVLARCGTTDETIPSVILAGKYAILAATLRKMKTTGEMAANIKTGNGQRQNTTDIDIDKYERKSESLIAQYTASASYVFTSYSDNIGITNHSHCGGHHHRHN